MPRMRRLCANGTTFRARDLSILGFGDPQDLKDYRFKVPSSPNFFVQLRLPVALRRRPEWHRVASLGQPGTQNLPHGCIVQAHM